MASKKKSLLLKILGLFQKVTNSIREILGLPVSFKQWEAVYFKYKSNDVKRKKAFNHMIKVAITFDDWKRISFESEYNSDINNHARQQMVKLTPEGYEI